MPDEFRLELLTDIDMLLMVEKGIRVGITQQLSVMPRYSHEDKYMKDLHNPDEKNIYLQYLNTNNLYGWAMVQNLTTHSFLWKKAEDFTHEKIDELVKIEKRSYLLEVDVEYLKELHENHNELLFLAERMNNGRRGGISTKS